METKIQPEWQGRAEKAMKESVDLTESELRDEQIGIQTARFIAGEISAEEYRILDEEYSADKRGHLSFSNAQQFEDALQWVLRKVFPGRDSDMYRVKARELAEHEEDHFDEVIRHGLKASFIIRFFRDRDDISFRPGITFDLPDGVEDSELRALMQSVIEAPKELSDLDETMLK